MLEAETFALLSAACYAGGGVMAKKGLRKFSTWSCVFWASIVSTPMLWGISVAATPKFEIVLPGLLIFMLIGLLATSFGSLFWATAFKRMAASLAQPLGGSQPLFSVILAAMFLGETLTTGNLTGTLLIVFSIALLTITNHGVMRLERNAIFPLGAAVIWGAGGVLKKVGLGYMDMPMIGAAIQSTFSLLMVSMLILGAKLGELKVDREAFMFFAGKGVLNGLGLLFMYLALSHGQVVLVAPLAGTTPIFMILLARFFLREERVTGRLVIGGVMMVLGVIAVTSR